MYIYIIVVYSFLCSQPRSNAPHTPRIVLLGPTGSGKGVQASLLANKYNIVNGKSNAPHTPRIVLLGPTGSGKGVQASLLANKYNIVSCKYNFALPSNVLIF